MNLEEQLKMATMTTTTAPVEQAVQPVITADTQIQSQPVQASVQAPVQYANVQELQPAPVQSVPMVPTIQESNGIQMIQLGQQFNTRPINAVKKLGVGEQIRFTLLNKEGFFIKYHYIDGMGKYACFEGDCCKELGQAKHRYVLPVLVYPTLPNNAALPIQGQPAELKVLPIWDDAAYQYIFTKAIDPINTPVDFIATGTDNFGRMSIVDQPTSYKNQFANDVAKANDLWAKHKDTVPSLICKTMNETSYQELKTRMAAAGPNNNANYNNGYGTNYQNYNGIM